MHEPERYRLHDDAPAAESPYELILQRNPVAHAARHGVDYATILRVRRAVYQHFNTFPQEVWASMT